MGYIDLNLVKLTKILLLCFIFFTSSKLVFGEQNEIISLRSKHGSTDFIVEIAKTYEQRQKGLMGRNTLKAQNGMLFLYDIPRRVSFWMKDTNISLDVIFLSANGKILKIYHNAMPKSLEIMSAGDSVSAVLEINGNTAKTIQLSIGDCAEYEFFVNNYNNKSCNFLD